MAFSILHFSDLHLDAAFAVSRLPATIARQCRDQLRKSFSRIIDLAKDRQVDAVTIAGDLFEREKLSPDTAAFIIAEFERLSPIPVFIAPGNHDAADSVSLYHRGRWPDHIHIALRPKLARWQLSDELVLWAAAHVTPSERQNFLQDFELPKPGTFRAKEPYPVLLLHASAVATSIGDNRAHAPLTLDDIRVAGFNLALLGHYHTYKKLRDGPVLALYPGSPEPLGFAESGPHGVVIVEIDASREPSIEFIPTAALRFETTEVAVDGCQHRDQLIEKIIAVIDEKKLSEAISRVQLTGYVPASLNLDLEVIGSRLAEHARFISLNNLTHPEIDIDTLAAESTVRGAFVREVMELMEKNPENRHLYDQTLKYGLQAFDQEEIVLQ